MTNIVKLFLSLGLAVTVIFAVDIINLKWSASSWSSLVLIVNVMYLAMTFSVGILIGVVVERLFASWLRIFLIIMFSVFAIYVWFLYVILPAIRGVPPWGFVHGIFTLHLWFASQVCVFSVIFCVMSKGLIPKK